MPHRPIEIVTGRHPFQIASLGANVVVGLGLLITGEPPQSVTEGMPPHLITVWEAGLIMSGLIGLAGVFWPDYPRNIRSLSIELSGIIFLSTILTMYAIAVFVWAGQRGLVAGGMAVGLTGAAVYRSAQILRDRRRLNSALQKGQVVVVPLLAEPSGESG